MDGINSALTDQSPTYGMRRDLGGWTTIKTAGTDVEGGDLPWHGTGVQPKSELTNQIWVLITINNSQNRVCYCL